MLSRAAGLRTEVGLDLMHLLVMTSAVLTVLLTGLVVALLTSGLYMSRRGARDHRWLGDVDKALFADDGDNPLWNASRRRQALALGRLGQRVTGRQDQLLREWAVDVPLDRWARRQLFPRATAQVAGVSALTALGISDELRLSASRDRNPLVRMCAAETDGTRPSARRIDRLIELTIDPAPGVRFAARDSLARLGGPVAPALLRFLDSHDPAVSSAALDVAQTTPHPVLLPAALRMCKPDRTVPERLRALRLLSRLDGPERVTVLRQALDDEDPHIRQAGADGLRRAEDVTSAWALSERLRDPTWEVRRAAGRALRELGPVGLVLLRAAVRCDDRYAVDMARTMLDLPPVPELVRAQVAPSGQDERVRRVVANGWQVAS